VLFYGDQGIPHGYYRGKWNRLEPRLGIVFDPRGQGKESIRASTVSVSRSRRSTTTPLRSHAAVGRLRYSNAPPGNLTTPYAAILAATLTQALSAHSHQRVFPDLWNLLRAAPEPAAGLLAELELERAKTVS